MRCWRACNYARGPRGGWKPRTERLRLAAPCLALALVCASSLAQRSVPLALDSGVVEHQGETWQAVYSETIVVPGAHWMRLDFADVDLGGGIEAEAGSLLELTSLYDGAVQYLNAAHVVQWQHSSAYFNGDAVQIRILAAPRSGSHRVSVASALTDDGSVPESLCGIEDDRVPAVDARIGRGLSAQGDAKCTAWVFNDCNRCLLTAGHCPPNFTQVHFNVPLSDPGGFVNFPPPQDQYAVDPSSWNFADFGAGYDFAYFGCFPNPNTNLTPGEAAGDEFSLITPPSASGQLIRVTGYGTTEPADEFNRTLLTHVGGYTSYLPGVSVRYTADTTGGNSGSPVLLDGSSSAIGIHTHGGCNEFGGSNLGTAGDHPALLEALSLPKGVCRPSLNLVEPQPSTLYNGPPGGGSVAPWPVDVAFSVVAGADALQVKINDGPSVLSGVQVSSAEGFCQDTTAAGDLFECQLPADTGSQVIVASGQNAWGQSVITAEHRTLLFKPGDPAQTPGGWLAGSQVRMASGDLRSIETLLPGEEIRAVDLLTGNTFNARVRRLVQHPAAALASGYVVLNFAVRLAPEHLLRVNGVLTPAGDVAIGDLLDTETGGGTVVVDVQAMAGPVASYDVEIGGLTRACNAYYACFVDGLVSYPQANQVVAMLGGALYTYGLDLIGALPGQTTSVAHAVNATGMAVGSSGSSAMRWTPGAGSSDLGPGVAHGVNSGGVVAGTSNGQAVIWSSTGAKSVITSGVAFDVNESGVVVGTNGTQAFRWSGGVLTLLGSGVAYAINNNGVIAGTSGGQAVYWTATNSKVTLAAGVALDVNDAGMVVGQSNGAAFRWQNNQFVTITAGVAQGVNGAGVVVGETAAGQPFTWSAATGLRLLQSDVWQWSGWTLQTALDINAMGEIVGGGVIGGAARGFSAVRTDQWADSDSDFVPDVCELGGSDCNGNGVPDELDIAGGFSVDCNLDGVPDECELAAGLGTDCNSNGVLDECDIAAGLAPDCNGNNVPDACDLSSGVAKDCNTNGVPDSCDIALGVAQDCNGNTIPDSCDLGPGGVSDDCNLNGKPDECDIAGGVATDCNANGVPDSCDIASGLAKDCNGNAIPDSCDLGPGGVSDDCNLNGKPDECDIASGVALDCNFNAVPDSCDIASGFAKDCNGNAIPDSCDIGSGFSADCNGNGIPDNCDITSGAAKDCNSNGVPDSCDIASGVAKDCNLNGIPDGCDIATGVAKDCNLNGIPDGCDIASGVAKDCNSNGIPDSCDIAAGVAQDCNSNGIPDSCDVASGTSDDLNGNGVPDECQDCNNNGIPDGQDIGGGTSPDEDDNGVPDECQLPGSPLLISPPDLSSGVVLNPVLKVQVDNDYAGLMDVTFLTTSPPQTLTVSSESDWAQGTFDDTVTNGSGSLRLGVDSSFFGNGSDGSLTLPGGAHQLAGDAQFLDLTLLPGATLDTRGYLLRVARTLTNQGVITDTVSGGAGGAGGTGGQGQDPRQNNTPKGPLSPQPGQCGSNGASGVTGAGAGGRGGGGGGGGGAGWSTALLLDGDGGWNTIVGPETERGRGGDGGRGGGAVRIRAESLVNSGVIHADGQPGLAGQKGGPGQRFVGAGMDLCGGGGGGGGGGDGGRGGTVEIFYQTLSGSGQVRAAGGVGGNGGAGGTGHLVQIGTTAGAKSNAAQGVCGGGNGGAGEYVKNLSSANGAAGVKGANGASGVTSLTPFSPQQAPSGTYVSPLLCLSSFANWQSASVDASVPAQTTLLIEYSTGNGVWHPSIASVPDSLCIQFRVTMTSASQALTPLLHAVSIEYVQGGVLGAVSNVAPGGVASMLWSDLDPFTTFCWSVVVVDKAGASIGSPQWCFETGSVIGCVSDLTGDGLVNQLDLNLLLADFGCTGACAADLNSDGATNQLDLNLLLSEFGAPCP